MGLVDQLWDDTIAGPPPDSGLGKLRKNATFNIRSDSSGKVKNRKSFGDEAAEDAVKVTRSIMILRRPVPNVELSPASPSGSTPPISPAGSTPPASPFSDSGGREAYRFRRRSASFAYEKGVGSRSTATPYDV